ncbi:MAG: DUF2878 domain-containing protein [Endozoicomonas sp.]
MTRERTKQIVNYLLFQAGWFACVLGGDQIALITTLVILFIHLRWIGQWRMERELLAISLILGSAIDSFLGNLEILIFPGDGRLLPVWLACLWLLFGTTLRHSFDWAREHRLASALLGMIGGPASYYAGTKLTNVSLMEPTWLTLLILAVIWAAVIPVLQAFSAAWLKRHEIGR